MKAEIKAPQTSDPNAGALAGTPQILTGTPITTPSGEQKRALDVRVLEAESDSLSPSEQFVSTDQPARTNQLLEAILMELRCIRMSSAHIAQQSGEAVFEDFMPEGIDADPSGTIDLTN